MSKLEESNAKIAVAVVKAAGGVITFDAFDAAMRPEFYFTPMHWSSGWGLSRSDRKANTDKMCAFVACRDGLLRQTETGYEVVGGEE